MSSIGSKNGGRGFCPPNRLPAPRLVGWNSWESGGRLHLLPDPRRGAGEYAQSRIRHCSKGICALSLHCFALPAVSERLQPIPGFLINQQCFSQTRFETFLDTWQPIFGTNIKMEEQSISKVASLHEPLCPYSSLTVLARQCLQYYPLETQTQREENFNALFVIGQALYFWMRWIRNQTVVLESIEGLLRHGAPDFLSSAAAGPPDRAGRERPLPLQHRQKAVDHWIN